MENLVVPTEKIRNIAVIAHVDHGKTTLVDFFMKQSHTFGNHEDAMTQTTILDSNPLEKERGITILAKNTTITYKDYKINIIDTPGHADFSGEVERTLNMADGALLIVDAQEGPMPQTTFVLKKALDLGLKIILVINKIDKQLANPQDALNKSTDLFLELATHEDHLSFPVFYAIGREGKAAKTVEEVASSTSLTDILDAICEVVPPPTAICDTFKMLVSALDYDSHKGRHLIGKISGGEARVGQEVVVLKANGKEERGKIDHMYQTHGVRKYEVQFLPAGDIAEMTGVEKAEIGDTLTTGADKTALPRIEVEEPTLKMLFGPNTSPFAGKEGTYTTSRQILERLEKELETNISLRLEVIDQGFLVSGRGELHLSVLIETLRREGYELQVSKPTVITKMVDGKEHEPIETLLIDVPDEFVGQVTEEVGRRKGIMENMETNGRGETRLMYNIPSKNFIGARSMLLTKTKGTAIINSLFKGFEPMAPFSQQTRNGVLIASEAGTALTYGLENAQERGTTFIPASTNVYEGMIVGLNTRQDDIEINVTKAKQQTNMRSSSADISIALTPPTILSLEQCLDFLEDDELLEVTPESLRLRKKYLNRIERNRAARS